MTTANNKKTDPDQLANACIAFGVSLLLVGIVWIVWRFAT